MKNLKNGFSLVEILIAGTILTVGVFGIYKLFGSNMLLLSNNENYVQGLSLEIPLKECLKNIGYNNLSSYSSGDYFSVNFGSGNMNCMTGSYDSNYSFSGVDLNSTFYYMYAVVKQKNSDKITIETNIYNDTFGVLNKGDDDKLVNIYK